MIKAILWSAIFIALSSASVFWKSDTADSLLVFACLLSFLLHSFHVTVSMFKEEEAHAHFIQRQAYLRRKSVVWQFGVLNLGIIAVAAAGHPILGIILFTTCVASLSTWFHHFERWENANKEALGASNRAL